MKKCKILLLITLLLCHHHDTPRLLATTSEDKETTIETSEKDQSKTNQSETKAKKLSTATLMTHLLQAMITTFLVIICLYGGYRFYYYQKLKSCDPSVTFLIIKKHTHTIEHDINEQLLNKFSITRGDESILIPALYKAGRKYTNALDHQMGQKMIFLKLKLHDNLSDTTAVDEWKKLAKTLQEKDPNHRYGTDILQDDVYGSPDVLTAHYELKAFFPE